MQVLRNLHREVMELNSELNLLKKTVFLSERELEEYQLRTEDCQYEVSFSKYSVLRQQYIAINLHYY